MRFLGIDYGSKRVGLALSDASGRFASPYLVLPADSKLVSKIVAICEKEGVEKIVIGESKDLRGALNPIMKKVEKFREALGAAVSLPIDYEPELFTSVEAMRSPAGGAEKMPDDGLLDARAAALILKSYLDRDHD